MAPLPAPSRSALTELAWPALLAAAMLLALGLGWIGYTGSDDASYYEGALRWLTDAPYPGDDHWTTRFPVILSLAASLLIFGKGFAALGATALAWYVALIVVVGLFAARIGGRTAGWIAAILVATLPVIASEASPVGCDLAEALFLIAGTWLITADREGWRLPFAAGICFGLAIICRETAALALLGFVPLFLLGRPIPRRALIVMGIATALLLLGEATFQWAVTGDPLRRYALAFHHDGHIDRAANLEGNLLVHPAIDPLLVLLVNNDFALLFWLTLAAVAGGCHRGLGKIEQQRLLVAAILAGTAFLLVALLTTKLVLNPRYFTLPALVAAIATAIWLAKLRPRARFLILGAAVSTNLLMLSAQNAHPHWSAEALVLAAAAHPREPVHTDPQTFHRARHPLAFSGLRNAHAAAPAPGVLYLSPEGEGSFGARPLARLAVAPTPLGRAVQALGLTPLLPAAVAHRLLQPAPAMLLWRVERQ
jgi:4-amino-4-deoxy-L-arabinose transferase-like glycosyltransferase